MTDYSESAWVNGVEVFTCKLCRKGGFKQAGLKSHYVGHPHQARLRGTALRKQAKSTIMPPGNWWCKEAGIDVDHRLTDPEDRHRLVPWVDEWVMLLAGQCIQARMSNDEAIETLREAWRIRDAV